MVHALPWLASRGAPLVGRLSGLEDRHTISLTLHVWAHLGCFFGIVMTVIVCEALLQKNDFLQGRPPVASDPAPCAASTPYKGNNSSVSSGYLSCMSVTEHSAPSMQHSYSPAAKAEEGLPTPYLASCSHSQARSKTRLVNLNSLPHYLRRYLIAAPQRTSGGLHHRA